MEGQILKIIGVQAYHGLSRTGKPYFLYTLEVDYSGEKAKIKTFLEGAVPGDYAQIVVGTRSSVYGRELTAIVQKIIPGAELEENFK
ncbi:MAG TPA: hypothetical protein IAA26_11205 [Candidatus Blautia faecipullorum]|nr:hypothetical protein [Candidatus Blautia faecipullorum]